MKPHFLLALALAILTFFVPANSTADSIARITAPVLTEFGTYEPVIVSVTPSVTPYDINTDLSNVGNISDFELTAEARELLGTNGFAAVAGSYRQIYDIYNECTEREIPVFVTTDACLHTYHILYDYILRIIEVSYFIDDLDVLTRAMRDDMQAVYDAAANSSVKEAAAMDIAYLSVPYGLLNPEMSDYPALAAEEISLIHEGSTGYINSPLLYNEDYPYDEDYSQYKPRGHYTRSTELERYFRAMMWYGRITYSLDLLCATQEGLRRAAVQALLLCRSLATTTVERNGTVPVSELWERLYQPTVFFVGKMDDINYLSYLEIARQIFGEDFLTQSPDVLGDTEKIDAFIAAALELPDPKITVKAGKGFRFMGQRYIPDSYVLDQLVYDGIPDMRIMPRGLDVMAVLGSDRAFKIIETYYDDMILYPSYAPKILLLNQEFSGYAPKIWAQNLYYNWLYTLAPLLDVKESGYPPFMQTEAWVDKDLNNALGSWAELRHDTILYAKQSETLETSEPNPPSLVTGYVEPNPEVYARLAALADFMRRGFDDRGILHELFAGRLGDFEVLMLALKDIAVKELVNITPTNEEFALICNFGKEIEHITSFPPDIVGQFENDADDFMAVIADVHTDPNTNQCLEVGVGHPLNLYVIAPVNGVPTLTRGGIFSYHEFKQPLAEGRLTDEEWQELQSGPDAREMPEWAESFLAGASSLKNETTHYFSKSSPVVPFAEDNQPGEFNVLQNHPNPFNPSTTITYQLSENGRVTLAVYNLSGQLIATLMDSWQESGLHSFEWKPEELSSGMYIIRIEQNGRIKAIKTMFLK